MHVVIIFKLSFVNNQVCGLEKILTRNSSVFLSNLQEFLTILFLLTKRRNLA